MMTNEEEWALREYAAGRACTQSVIDALGPMSLWSKSSFDAEIRKAVEAEREACAKMFDELAEKATSAKDLVYLNHTAALIRARKII
jgi:hypothetical protein